jgi:uncharacterized protein (DUF362 family)
MFYRCQKCKKVWQYPIKKCPECFLEPERLESKKLKVIGVSRVIIPSVTHPKVPYFVVVLEDENGNKFVQKTSKEYKIGDIFEIKKEEGKNQVSIWRVKYDLGEAIEKVISLISQLEVNNKKILILPTLVSVSHPYLSENTHPEILDELLNFLLKRGARPENIKVVGQSFSEAPIEAMAKKSQILSVCEKNKVEFQDLAKFNFKRIEKDNLVFEISEKFFENDLVINLPILKLDKNLGVRGAMENLTKLWKKESYLGQKYLYPEEELILKLKEVLGEVFTIADATVVQRQNKQVAILDLLLGSFNPLNLDRVFAEILEVPLPKFLNSIKIENIPISGREIGEIKFNLENV